MVFLSPEVWQLRRDQRGPPLSVLRVENHADFQVVEVEAMPRSLLEVALGAAVRTSMRLPSLALLSLDTARQGLLAAAARAGMLGWTLPLLRDLLGVLGHRLPPRTPATVAAVLRVVLEYALPFAPAADIDAILADRGIASKPSV